MRRSHRGARGGRGPSGDPRCRGDLQDEDHCRRTHRADPGTSWGGWTCSSTTRPSRSVGTASRTSPPRSGSGPCARTCPPRSGCAAARCPSCPPAASIINVSSIQALQPSPSLLAYATTKGALVTFSRGSGRLLASRPASASTWWPRVPCGPRWSPPRRSPLRTEPVRCRRAAGGRPNPRSWPGPSCSWRFSSGELHHGRGDRRDRRRVLQLAAIRPARGPRQSPRRRARR